jgi:hypothetical protein
VLLKGIVVVDQPATAVRRKWWLLSKPCAVLLASLGEATSNAKMLRGDVAYHCDVAISGKIDD